MRQALAIPLFLLALLSAHAQPLGSPTLPPPCQAIDQSISVVTVFNPDEPQGQQLMMLQLYNSGATCSLSGMPALGFSSNASLHYSSKLVPVAIDDSLADTSPNTVVLQHGELAHLRIAWSAAQPTAAQKHSSACRSLDAIRIALPNDAPLTEIVALTTHVCGALHVSHFTWGWVHQSNILRASWAANASPMDDVVFKNASGSIFGDHFNGIAMSLKTSAKKFPLGTDIQLESHVKNIEAPREPVVGNYPYRWLSMREANGHTVLYSLGTAPPTEAGMGDPVPLGQGLRLPNLKLADLGMLPDQVGNVTYALTAEFWPARTLADGSLDPDALAFAPTAVVSYRLTLNFTAPN